MKFTDLGDKGPKFKLKEFAAMAGGDDGRGDDPYKHPKPEHFSRSIDFFGQFEADHFDREDMNDATGEFKGYWDKDQIAYFKFDNPKRTGSDDPGMGWYYEPQGSVDEASLAQMRDYFAGKMSLTDEPTKSKPGELARMRDHFSKEKPMYTGGTAPNRITDKMPPDIVMILHAVNKGTAITKAQFSRLQAYKMYGESVEGVAEDWQEDSQELEDWSKEVNKRLYRAHESQRPALARQLSKLEQKNFGSSLNQGSLTELVHAALMAIQKGQMVHYDPQSVGQMPFGTMVGDDARIIASNNVSSDELAGYRMLSNKGIVDNIQQFLKLRHEVYNKEWPIEYIDKFEGRPGELWLQLVKDIGWSKDDVSEAVQAKTDDKLRAYYAQRKAEKEKQKQQQGVAEVTGDKPFDKMMTTIKQGTGKQKTADRKEQQKQTQQRARDAFGNMFGGGNPADQLKIREQGVAEGGEFGTYYCEELAQKVFDQNPNLSCTGRCEELLDAAWPIAVADLGQKRAQHEFSYNEDFPSDFVSAYSHLQKQGVAESFNGEYDDEAGMAKSNLHTMARAVNGLLDTIDDNENLPEWAQEKIAKAEMMVTGVWDYLISQEEQGIDPKVNEAGANPYAIGMSQAMKSTGDKPPLKKSTINKAHAIARAIEKDK